MKRQIQTDDFIAALKNAIAQAAFELPCAMCKALERAVQNEEEPLARSILEDCVENAKIAHDEHVSLCQDTGSCVVFIRRGIDAELSRGTFEAAVNEAVRSAYDENYLRKSIVSDPLFDRINTHDNTPAILHMEEAEGDALEIDVALKGGGAENMSSVMMLTPSAGVEGVFSFVVETVRLAGGNPCPPIIIGIGVGGNFETCTLLAKKALLQPVDAHNSDSRYAELEQRILHAVNALHIGPQGLGGKTTALAVHILHAPCHIASLPVAVNINCHSARHVHITL